MKFSCEKSSLISAIVTSASATAAKSAVASLEGLLIEADADVSITGYNLKTGIKTSFDADVTESGSIVLNARLFGDIVRRFEDDIVTFEADENLMVKLSCGMSEFQIIGISAVDYPELPTVEFQNSIVIKESVLKDMIRRTIFAVSDNEARPIHTGSLFDIENGELTLVSVDGYRLAIRRETIGTDAQDGSFVVPGYALSEVEKILTEDDEKEVKITLGLKHILFSMGRTILVSRRLEGEFLNYKNSIPKTAKYEVIVDRRTFQSAIERVSLIINDKLKSPVRCVFGENNVSILTSTSLGKANDECICEGSAENLEIGFNNKYILDALKAAPDDKLKVLLSTSVSPCIIVPCGEKENFLYMILPVRLRSNENKG